MSNYQRATIWLGDLVEHRVGKSGDLVFLDMTFADAVREYCSVIEYIKPDQKRSFYEVTDKIARELVELAKFDADFFNVCTDICIANIGAGKPVPYGLYPFANDVLRGRIRRPTPANRPRAKNWNETYFLYKHITLAVESFSLNLTRNDGSPQISACDAMAEALSICGRPTKYSEMKNLMVHSSKARLRAEFIAFERIMARSKCDLLPDNRLDEKYHTSRDEEAEKTVFDINSTLEARGK